MDAGLTEVLSTAAGEAGLSGHMQTQGAFVITHTLNKLTLVATQLRVGHFAVRIVSREQLYSLVSGLPNYSGMLCV